MRAGTSPLRLLHWDPHFYTHRQFYMWCRSPGQLTLSEQVGFTVWHVVVIGHMWGLILSKTRSRWHPLSSRVHQNRSHLGWDAPRRRKSIFLLCFAITCPVLALFECLKTEKVTQTHHRNFKMKGTLKKKDVKCWMLGTVVPFQSISSSAVFENWFDQWLKTCLMSFRKRVIIFVSRSTIS